MDSDKFKIYGGDITTGKPALKPISILITILSLGLSIVGIAFNDCSIYDENFKVTIKDYLIIDMFLVCFSWLIIGLATYFPHKKLQISLMVWFTVLFGFCWWIVGAVAIFKYGVQCFPESYATEICAIINWSLGLIAAFKCIWKLGPKEEVIISVV